MSYSNPPTPPNDDWSSQPGQQPGQPPGQQPPYGQPPPYQQQPPYQQTPPPPPPPPGQSPYGGLPGKLPTGTFGGGQLPSYGGPGGGSGRPGCITVYVLLMFLGALVMVCGGVSFMSFSSLDDSGQTRECREFNGETYCGTQSEIMQEIMEDIYGMSISTLGVIILIMGVFYFITGVGLWQMTPWGWWMYMIGAVISIAFSILGLFSGGAGVLGNLIGIVVAGLIMMWFVSNRWRFA